MLLISFLFLKEEESDQDYNQEASHIADPVLKKLMLQNGTWIQTVRCIVYRIRSGSFIKEVHAVLFLVALRRFEFLTVPIGHYLRHLSTSPMSFMPKPCHILRPVESNSFVLNFVLY